MSDNTHSDVKELKEILVGFIAEQKIFNEEQKSFNETVTGFIAEQKSFNEEIIRKIDKAQYFLEESLAQNTKMFFEEQIELRVTVKEMEDEISHLKNDMILFTSQMNMLLAR